MDDTANLPSAEALWKLIPHILGGSTHTGILRIQPSGELSHREVNNGICINFLDCAICCMYYKKVGKSVMLKKGDLTEVDTSLKVLRDDKSNGNELAIILSIFCSPSASETF
jgi:hypothetical protein